MNRWWAGCSARPSPSSAVSAASRSWTAMSSSSLRASRRTRPSQGCDRTSRVARRAPRTTRACAPCWLLEGDDLLDAAGPVGEGHGDQGQRGVVDLLVRRARAPGRRIRRALIRGQLVARGLNRVPDLRAAEVEVSLAAVAEVEPVGQSLLAGQQLADVAVEVLVPAGVLAARGSIPATGEGVQLRQQGLAQARGEFVVDDVRVRGVHDRGAGIVDLAVAVQVEPVAAVLPPLLQ